MGLTTYIFTTLFIQILIISQKGCLCTISCFTCSSRNGSDTDCEDPFHPGNDTYTERCKVPKRGHQGEFPAHFCIKVIGTSYTTKEKLIIRRCVIENMDSQCGNFRLQDDVLHGCVLTCDLDGCNSSSTLSLSIILLAPTFMVLAGICLSLFSSSFDTIGTNHKRHALIGNSTEYDDDTFLKTLPRQCKQSLCSTKSHRLNSREDDASPLSDTDTIIRRLTQNILKKINRINLLASLQTNQTYI